MRLSILPELIDKVVHRRALLFLVDGNHIRGAGPKCIQLARNRLHFTEQKNGQRSADNHQQNEDRTNQMPQLLYLFAQTGCVEAGSGDRFVFDFVHNGYLTAGGLLVTPKFSRRCSISRLGLRLLYSTTSFIN